MIDAAHKTCILCVVGARPNFIKIAPILKALAQHPEQPRSILLHTGQHYDAAMSDRLFQDLKLPTPDINLEVGSGTHSQQTADVMRKFEPALDQIAPSVVLVVGDVNSTLACSLVAAKKQIPVVHVEAGLRSFDRRMPEEINRILTDQIADVLYTTERAGEENLAREGIPSDRIVFVGNVMIDALFEHRKRAPIPEDVLRRANLSARSELVRGHYGVVTLHRPSNVDTETALHQCIAILLEVSAQIPLICALHPRTWRNIERFGLAPSLSTPRIVITPPLGYLDMLGLMSKASLVLSDSGGIQEETTALGVPCLTMRENTERPITIDEGTNTLVGRDRAHCVRLVRGILADGGKRGRLPALWDGHAAERIANHLVGWLNMQPAR